MRRLLVSFALTVALPICVFGDLTGLGVITTRGWVSYAVGSKWKVLSMQTQPPTTAVAFQIANPADEGTPDSTNVAIMTFEADSKEAMASLKTLVSKIQSQAKPKKYKKDWDLYIHQDKQGQTDYVLCDAVRQVPGASVLIRISWPHLKGNAPDYDSQMEEAYLSLLDSVEGGLGPKPKKDGEVYRRPTK
ncbi:MAG TPA: hypothetical protein VM940_15170 [Chthoniobacterales bacterium]|jgi:hypothetical protein|nr:hypothetical protein [Chthoniobacterales bacterium]